MAYLMALLVFVVSGVLGVTLDRVTGALNLGHLAYFLDLPALLLVPAGVAVLAAAVLPQRSAIVQGILRPGELTAEAARSVRNFLGRLVHLSLATGMVGALVGLTMMLQALNTPQRVGPPMATAILSLLYGMTVALVAHAAHFRVSAQHPPAETERPAQPITWSLFAYVGVGMFCMLLVLTVSLQAPG